MAVQVNWGSRDSTISTLQVTVWSWANKLTSVPQFLHPQKLVVYYSLHMVVVRIK